MRLPLYINAIDFSKAAHKYGYAVQYEDRTGPNTGNMLSGDSTYDLLDRKAVITWQLNDLPSATLSQLMTVCRDKYVSVTFFDPMLDRDRTGVFAPTITGLGINMLQGGVKWFGGGVLTLKEK